MQQDNLLWNSFVIATRQQHQRRRRRCRPRRRRRRWRQHWFWPRSMLMLMPPIINFVAKNGFQKQRQISNCESQHFWDDSNIFFQKKIQNWKNVSPDMATESQKTLKQYLLPGYRKQHATLLLLNTFLTQRSVFNISWPLAILLQACYLATYKIAPSRQFHEWQRSATML